MFRRIKRNIWLFFERQKKVSVSDAITRQVLNGDAITRQMLEIFAYRTVAVMYFTDQNWISKTIYCIRRVMVCKIGFTNWNAKIVLLRAFMVLTFYIKLFRTWPDRHNDILMSLLLLVAEAKKNPTFLIFSFLIDCRTIFFSLFLSKRLQILKNFIGKLSLYI